jgi:POT family proton-dependent oligopeptide transporter
VGGFLADRVLGFKRAIVWGGLFLVLGYATLAIPHKMVFYPALAIIIVGNGLFKPNISSLLGTLYDADNPRRESGFTLFYIGINIGSFLAGISSGYIREHFGWHTSFGLASIGLIIGLITFYFGLHTIHRDTQHPMPLKQYKFLKKPWIVVYCILAIIFLSSVLGSEFLADYLLPGLGVLVLTFMVMLAARQEGIYRQQVFILNILIISSVVFWMMFFQIFFSANLFVERLVDKEWFGFHTPTTVFYAAESVFIILLGPFFAWFWEWLSARNENPAALNKFSLGIFFAGLGFLVLATGIYLGSGHLINPLWVVFAYFLITIGELFLSPIGLSAITLLAPPHLIGMMMGIWFVGTGFGGIFAGWLAKIASVPETVTSIPAKLAIYQHAFLIYAFIAFAVALILFFIQQVMKKQVRSLP